MKYLSTRQLKTHFIYCIFFQEEAEWQPIKNLPGDYNLIKLSRFAMELVKNKFLSNLGAALANALLRDIKHMSRNDVDTVTS